MIKYRLETNEGIAARPTYLPPDPGIVGDSGVIYAASRDGFVHGIREKDGESLWRFSVGEPILQPAVVIQQRVYVATQLGGMYCLDAKTGNERWWTPQILQFVAASKERVYAADKLGRVAILSAETGARLDSIPTTALPIKLINSETDRLYLATETGLVQCLHELELSEPIRHGEALKRAAGEEGPAIEQKGIEELGPPQEPGVQEGPPGVKRDPFGGGAAEDPLGGGGAQEDPLGGGAGEDPLGGGADDPFK